MSTREIAYSIIDGMTDEQLEDFVVKFKKLASNEDIPNDETIEAMREAEDMKKRPEKYKGYDDIDVMFKELLA